jgi:hypothetical protein
MTNPHLLEEKISGNIVPNSWYKIFKTCNKPDLIAITILSEVLFKYRTGEVIQGKWRVNYGYFENKFDFSKNQIRSALTRLEVHKIVVREIKTESHNDRKYGGVLYLIYNHEVLQSIQKNFLSPQKKLIPPCEKPHPNKSSNKIILTIKDVEKINELSASKYTLVYCQETLERIQNQYPNLIFSSKPSLIRYLQKTLKSSNNIGLINNSSVSLTSLCKENSSDLNKYLSVLADCDEKTFCENWNENIYEFNQKMSSLIKNTLPKEVVAKIENSFLLCKAKDGSLFVKILCPKSLVFPHQKSLIEIAKNVLQSSNIVFQYLKFSQLCSAKLFAILKLRLYFTHGIRMYSSWFKHLSFGSFRDNELILFGTNQFITGWIDEHWGQEILGCINSFCKDVQGVKIQLQIS